MAVLRGIFVAGSVVHQIWDVIEKTLFFLIESESLNEQCRGWFDRLECWINYTSGHNRSILSNVFSIKRYSRDRNLASQRSKTVLHLWGSNTPLSISASKQLTRLQTITLSIIVHSCMQIVMRFSWKSYLNVIIAVHDVTAYGNYTKFGTTPSLAKILFLYIFIFIWDSYYFQILT